MKAIYSFSAEQKQVILDLYYPDGVKKDVDVGFDPFTSGYESYIIYDSEHDILAAIPYSLVYNHLKEYVLGVENEVSIDVTNKIEGYYFDFKDNTLTYSGSRRGWFDHASIHSNQILEMSLPLISLESTLYPDKIFTAENEREYWDNVESDADAKRLEDLINSLKGEKFADYKHLSNVVSIGDFNWFDFPDDLYWENETKKRFFLSLIPDWTEYVMMYTENKNALVYIVYEDVFVFINPNGKGIYDILEGERLKESDISEFFHALRHWSGGNLLVRSSDYLRYDHIYNLDEEIDLFNKK
jgi:hypothetical protein